MGGTVSLLHPLLLCNLDKLEKFEKLRIRSSCTLSIPSLSAWQRVNSEHKHLLDSHGRHWWKRTGYALAVFLDKSSYCYHAQVDILNFFARFVAPRLGTVNELGVEKWKSYMTDDYNPVELSWDWSFTNKPPTIRFAFEPIGEHAGTVQDPKNERASEQFLALIKVHRPWNMDWFSHFDTYFNHGVELPADLSHKFKMFWGFDLHANNMAGKAYFSPHHKAISAGKTVPETISEAIETAPCFTRKDLSALRLFQEFLHDQTKAPIEVGIFAIDLVGPSKSRLKIYFRSRDTSFRSVRDIMSLGGRLINKNTEKGAKKGIRNLRRLWDSLFDQEGVPDDASLPSSNHETSGILYYVDFRIGDELPRVKVYLPVRHYAKSDWQIMNAVTDYMSLATADLYGNSSPGRSAPLAFRDAMLHLFGEETLRRRKGKQTYVSCSIQDGGVLRVTSYINPRINNVIHARRNEKF